MITKAPSVNRIRDFLSVSADAAKVIRKIIRGEINPMEIESVAHWVNRCYHTPGKGEQKMEALSVVMGGYGVESVFGNNPYIPKFTYVNTGDTYNPTIVRRPGGKYVLTTWGDEVERAGL